MPKPLNLSVVLAFLSSSFLILTAGCSGWRSESRSVSPALPSSPMNQAIAPSDASAIESPAESLTESGPDTYRQAIAQASSAFTIGRSATSGDDWGLVVSRWQQAIELMQTVPKDSPHHTEAARKLAEYRRNLTYAQRQIDRLVGSRDANPVIVVRAAEPQRDKEISIAASRPTVSEAETIPVSASKPDIAKLNAPSLDGAFSVPIVRRAGNTPVVLVTFNGTQTYEMIVDTGASGTLITQQMASELGVVPIAKTSVDTASARDVSFPLGYVQSVSVGGVTAKDMLVAVAGPDLNLGLLGHDFFGNYDVTIRQDTVEFHARSYSDRPEG